MEGADSLFDARYESLNVVFEASSVGALCGHMVTRTGCRTQGKLVFTIA